MAECGICGTENPDDAFTCAGCGEALGLSARRAAPVDPMPPAGGAAPYPPAYPQGPGEPYPPAYPQAYPQGPAGGAAPYPPAYPQAYPQGPPAYGVPPGPYQQPYPVVVNEPTSSKAVTSLVLGILGIFFCPIILSVMAMIFGKQAKEEIARSMGTVGGYSMANAGYILGIVGLAIYGVFIALYAVLFIIAASSSGALVLPPLLL